jgi:hypothetical protein
MSGGSVELADEVDVFVVFLLDAFYHSFSGVAMLVERSFGGAVRSARERERVVRFLFSVRHAVDQLPNCFEFNLRAIDRMVKHMLASPASDDTTTGAAAAASSSAAPFVWPWAVEDFSRAIYTNAHWRPGAGATRPNTLIEALARGRTDWQMRLRQMKFVSNELSLRKQELTDRLAAVAAGRPLPPSSLGAHDKPARMSRAQSTSSPSFQHKRRSRSLGRRSSTAAAPSSSSGTTTQQTNNDERG